MIIEKTKDCTARQYAERFVEFMKTGFPITDKSGDIMFVPDEGEEFRQCYADTPARRDFPKYWFVSRQGNLLSAYYNSRVIFIQKDVDKEGYQSYHFMLNDHNKKIGSHNLVALVYEAEVYGLAQKKLNEDGLYAFGRIDQEDKIQGHHTVDGLEDDPEHTEIVTSCIHKLIETVPDHTATEEEVLRYMLKLGMAAGMEEPESPSILYSGELLDKETGKYCTGGEKRISTIQMDSLKFKNAQVMQVSPVDEETED